MKCNKRSISLILVCFLIFVSRLWSMDNSIELSKDCWQLIAINLDLSQLIKLREVAPEICVIIDDEKFLDKIAKNQNQFHFPIFDKCGKTWEQLKYIYLFNLLRTRKKLAEQAFKQVQGQSLKIIDRCECWRRDLALSEDGKIIVWGNKYEENSLVLEPCFIEGSLRDEKIISIACDKDINAALNNQGEIYVWPAQENKADPAKLQLRGKIFKAIFCRDGRMLALSFDGLLYAWRFEERMSRKSQSNLYVPVLIEGSLKDKKILEIAEGYIEWLALSDSGELYVWRPSDVEVKEALVINISKRFIALASTNNRVVALTSEGKVYLCKSRLKKFCKNLEMQLILIKDRLEDKFIVKIWSYGSTFVAESDKGEQFCWQLTELNSEVKFLSLGVSC